ncbi:helix-turn-helix domain-containing protein [Halobacillus karajensis]|uniref:helix-turn-helix domain-containing protein n=1 Tax=Halobacillus karajensis TaxID=195088 RepID=UPI0009442432|nr:helix-turn-helix transcriptional regulator [Halobacillus karajensis]
MENINKPLIIKSFGKHLKSVRLELGFSQEELAFRAGLDPTYISGVETGKRNPTITTVYQIAGALEISAQELLPEISEPGRKENSDE